MPGALSHFPQSRDHLGTRTRGNCLLPKDEAALKPQAHPRPIPDPENQPRRLSTTDSSRQALLGALPTTCWEDRTVVLEMSVDPTPFCPVLRGDEGIVTQRVSSPGFPISSLGPGASAHSTAHLSLGEAGHSRGPESSPPQSLHVPRCRHIFPGFPHSLPPTGASSVPNPGGGDLSGHVVSSRHPSLPEAPFLFKEAKPIHLNSSVCHFCPSKHACFLLSKGV